MEDKYLFNDIYNDFFNNKSLIKNYTESEFTIKKEEIVQEKSFDSIFEDIDNLYIKEESKEMLKKICDYMVRFNKQEKKIYLPFNIKIYSNDYEITKKIIEIIKEIVKNTNYLSNSNINEKSLLKLEKVEEIEKIYDSKNSIIVLTDFEEIASKERIFKEILLKEIEEKSKDDLKKFITILVSDNKEITEQSIEALGLFKFEVISEKPDIQEVYQDVEEKLLENSKIEEDAKPLLIDYISNTYPKSEIAYSKYRDNLVNEILFNKSNEITKNDIPKYETDKSLDEIFKELNELVGLKKVKDVLNDLVNFMELKQKSNGELSIKNTNLHMVFLGNPGTGKTTVARIIAQILYNLKYIKQNKLIEVSSKDLVAEYVGQTAPKTMAVIEKAMGGVLFIDEAYSLASGLGQGNSYNEEAIATLIQAMENHRDDLVVIFAGYTKEMQSFLDSNSGIVSRIGYTLEFEDYTEEELLEIFKSMVYKANFKITDEALEKALNIIKEQKGAKNFGNARFVRNMYEKTIIKHASNTKGKKGKNILKTIEVNDVNIENLI